MSQGRANGGTGSPGFEVVQDVADSDPYSGNTVVDNDRPCLGYASCRLPGVILQQPAPPHTASDETLLRCTMAPLPCECLNRHTHTRHHGTYDNPAREDLELPVDGPCRRMGIVS
jgi:hypothetical protein